MKTHNKIFNISIILIAIIAIVFGLYFYYKLHKIEDSSSNKKEKEASSLVSKVSLHYLFPEGEVPTMAIVSDPDALKNQSFFISAQKGDNVLIFSKIGKAVLYRPSLDKIIDIVSIQNK